MSQSERLRTALLKVFLQGFENETGVKIDLADALIDLDSIGPARGRSEASMQICTILNKGCFTHYFDAIRLRGLQKLPKWQTGIATLFTGDILKRVLDWMGGNLHLFFDELDPEPHTSGDSVQHPSVVCLPLKKRQSHCCGESQILRKVHAMELGGVPGSP
jgi:hypothetical protein